MTTEQRKIYSLYVGGEGPASGGLKAAFLQGKAGHKCVHSRESLAWAAWWAGRDSKYKTNTEK